MAAAVQGRDARLWQWVALLQRELDEHEAAIASFERARRLAPNDRGIAHGLAQVTLEAGRDSIMLFDHAHSLGAPDSAILLGRAASRWASGQGEQALAEIEQILDQVPLWAEGHQQVAQLQAMLGRRDQAGRSIERALEQHPTDPGLWTILFELHIRAGDFDGLTDSVERARARGVDERLGDYEAIAASELGQADRADTLFANAAASDPRGLLIWRIRHLLRTARAVEASELVDLGLSGAEPAQFWPYASLAWRLTGDARSAWLEGDPCLVAQFDLARDLPPLDGLATRLRALHIAKGEYLDQSVRGGTQTDGPLFRRIDPEIRALRSAIDGAVRRYVEALPPIDPTHPLLGRRRDRSVRFAGSWSVRLTGAGFHENHVHPQGWISSAFYVALPGQSESDGANAGWLVLGEAPQSLGLALEPTRMIAPQPGQLVLFPSWMWHGTRPFANGERLTVAFDVAPPS